MKDPSTLTRTPATGPPPRTGVRPPVVERIAGWSARHRAIALIGWLLLVASAVVIGNTLGTKNLNSYDPGEAGRAERVLSSPGVVQRATESVLVQERASGRTIAADPQARAAIRQVTLTLERIPRVATNVQSPLAPGGTSLGAGGHGLISRDGRSALVTFEVAGNVNNADQIVAGAQRALAAVQAAHPGLRIAEAGEASVGRAINNVVSDDFRHAEVTSVPITLVLLLVVFGALIAAGIPLLLAGTAVATAISLLAIPSRWLPIGSTTSSVVLLVGMAVGIDYSLFYLRREREERAAGASQAEALRTAAATSGRAIVVSGLTVMISLAGLFLTGIDVFTGIAVGTITVVGVAVIGSLTALPALLSLLGTWVDKGKIPFLGRRRTAARRSAFWAALVRKVVARPVAWGGHRRAGAARAGRPGVQPAAGRPRAA
jgi:RND superfamily putative drug exporter